MVTACFGRKGLAVLRTIPQMDVVTIHGKLLTDIGCQHLAATPVLKSLALFEEATGQCLSRLELLANLETLDLLNAKLTDADCAQLSVLPSLKTLRISTSSVSSSLPASCGPTKGVPVLFDICQRERQSVVGTCDQLDRGAAEIDVTPISSWRLKTVLQPAVRLNRRR